MNRFDNKHVAKKIFDKLVKEGMISVDDSENKLDVIDEVLNQEFESGQTFEIPDCSWNKTPSMTTLSKHLECSTSHNFGNGRHVDCPQNIDDVIEHFSKKRNKGDEHDSYWNAQSEIITKVTTIKEVVAIIKPEDKV